MILSPSISIQAAPFAALLSLTTRQPNLPGGYVSVTAGGEASLLLDSPADVEAWREALDLPADAIACDMSRAQQTVKLSVPFGTTQVRLWAVLAPRQIARAEA
ncbi:hypothetical protein [Streptomyces sp. NPDC056707]|uniref:hypothetical protein n=1 Tax=Streptomyces sp. NPDC056707 TaxID=3345919 RepID=UPI0036C150F5